MKNNNIDLKKISEETAELLFKIKAVNFRFDPPFTFTSGLKSPIYLNNRVIFSHPKVRNRIIKFYIDILRAKVGLDSFNCVSGTASSAIPHATSISDRLNLPLVYIRPTTKSYGLGNKLEGYLHKGSNVVIIEDHVSTATSVINNAETVRENGGKVKYAVATTDYETQESINSLRKHKIKLLSLTTGRIIIDHGFKKGLITKEQKDSAHLWLKNQKKWAEENAKVNK